MSKHVKIGLFFTLSAIAITLYMLKTSDTFQGQNGSYTLFAYLEDASGLIVDSKVRVAGVIVGKLRKIELKGARVKATMQISKDVKIYKDAVVMKKMESMLGTSLLYISPGLDIKNPLNDGEYIENVISMTSVEASVENMKTLTETVTKIVDGVEKFIGKNGTEVKLTEILEIANKTSRDMESVLEKNISLITYTLENMAKITERINRNSEVEMKKFSILLENSVKLTEKLDRLVGDNDSEITESIKAVKESLKLISTQIESSKTITDDVKNITGKISRGEGNLGRLISDDKLFTKLENIAEKGSDFIDRTIGMELEVDFHSELMMEEQSTKDHFNLRIWPTSGDKYYLMGIVDSPRGYETTKVTETSIIHKEGAATPDEHYTTTEKKREDKVKLSLQMAKIFGPLTLRGGLIESSGGAGIDYFPMKYLSLSTEAFDFGRENSPYMRVYGNIYPVKWLYLNGGVDDLLMEDDRDFFIGGGIRFTDNDLKGIMGLIPYK